MTAPAGPVPPSVLAYGLLGVIPFWAAPAASLLAPNWALTAAGVEVAYAALILSFLGGARWGLAVREASPDPRVVGLAMLPTLVALAILVLQQADLSGKLFAFAAALTVSWAWDLRAEHAPPWYGRLRTLLTLGAVGGLCVSAWLAP